MGVMGCEAYFVLPRYILFYFKKNLKKSKKGLQPMTPMTLFCKLLILNKTDDNHSYLLFDIFYKKNIRACVLWGPRGPGRRRDPKGVLQCSKDPYAPYWCIGILSIGVYPMCCANTTLWYKYNVPTWQGPALSTHLP